MKRIEFLAALAVASLTLTGCNGTAPQAQLPPAPAPAEVSAPETTPATFAALDASPSTTASGPAAPYPVLRRTPEAGDSYYIPMTQEPAGMLGRADSSSGALQVRVLARVRIEPAL